MKKKIIMLISALTLSSISISSFSSSIIYADESMVETDANFDSDSEFEIEQISKEDIPDDVIVLKFDNVEEALNYIEIEEQMTEEGKALDLSIDEFVDNYDTGNEVLDLSDMEITEEDFSDQLSESDIEQINEIIPSANKGVKTATVNNNGISKIEIRATYEYKNNKFTKVSNVTSTYKGLTYGNSWVQDTYGSSIYNYGKKMSVTVYGHFDHYILVNWGFLRIASSSGKYSASWSY